VRVDCSLQPDRAKRCQHAEEPASRRMYQCRADGMPANVSCPENGRRRQHRWGGGGGWCAMPWNVPPVMGWGCVKWQVVATYAASPPAPPPSLRRISAVSAPAELVRGHGRQEFARQALSHGWKCWICRLEVGEKAAWNCVQGRQLNQRAWVLLPLACTQVCHRPCRSRKGLQVGSV